MEFILLYSCDIAEFNSGGKINKTRFKQKKGETVEQHSFYEKKIPFILF